MYSVFIILAALLLLLFAIPIRIRLSGQVVDTNPEFDCSVGMLLGAIWVKVIYAGALQWQICLGRWAVVSGQIGAEDDKEKQEEQTQEHGPEEKSVEAEKEKKGLLEQFSELRAHYTRFKAPVIRYLKRISKAVWFRKFKADCVVGTGTPESTGRLMGMVYAAEGGLGKRVALRIVPDFTRSVFSGRVQIDVWFWLGFLILATLLAALEIGTRFGLWYLQQKMNKLRQPKAQTV